MKKSTLFTKELMGSHLLNILSCHSECRDEKEF